MSKRAYRKDIRREISNTFGRFMCLFLIAALGVAFFTGIRVCEPDMMKSADRFFDENNLMDIEVISTGGLTDEDVRALEAIEGVDIVMPSYSVDMLEGGGTEQNVIKVISLPETLNLPRLSEGRLPERRDECLIDTKLIDFTGGYSVGDTITVTANLKDSEEEEPLEINTFTIVGAVTSPMYLDFGRGASKLGSGSVLGYIMVPEEVFTQDYYSVIYLTGKGLKEELSYTDAYNDKTEALLERVEAIADERCAAREAGLRADADRELDKARDEIADAKKEASDELEKARKELDDGAREIADAEAEYADGLKEIEENEQKLADAEKELADNEIKLTDAEAELERNRTQLTDARNELDRNWGQYDEAVEMYTAMGMPRQAAEAALADVYAQLDDAEDMYREKKAVFDDAEKGLADSRAELEAARTEIADGRAELEEGRTKLADAAVEIENAKKELADGEREYNDAEAEADEKIADAEAELADAEAEADELIKTPTWYVLDRDYVTSVVEFGQNANKIGAIGKVFPVIFFIVAILVCLTTMTRMVEEERTQIGTFKALGYTGWQTARKYVLYCLLASILGSALGAVLGEYILPFCIINAYYILYSNIPYLYMGIDLKLSLIAGAIACGCTLFATLIACGRATREKAAELMRPVAPLPGKRVFMERIGFIWKRLSFTMKASIRNLLRYQKRFWMTVIGIGGCMALMLVGFGLHDSIFTILDNQFYKIMLYDAAVSLDTGDEDKVAKVIDYVSASGFVSEYLQVHQEASDAGANGVEKEVYIVVPSDVTDFGHYIYMGDRVSGQSFGLGDHADGVVINEKLANLLEVSAGDTIYIKDADGLRIDVKVAAVTENYVYNYIYMVPEMYRETFGGLPDYNVLFFNQVQGSGAEEEAAFSRELLTLDAASGITYSHTSADTIYDMMSSLSFVVYVLVIAAALLAFVVLYNLSNININERRRELATLKVLGFYDIEVSEYTYRENFMLTVIGTVVGVGLGILLHRYVIVTAEVDMTFFGRNIKPMSYVYSACLNLLFAAAVNFVMHFKLKKIDMVESLKSVE